MVGVLTWVGLAFVITGAANAISRAHHDFVNTVERRRKDEEHLELIRKQARQNREAKNKVYAAKPARQDKKVNKNVAATKKQKKKVTINETPTEIDDLEKNDLSVLDTVIDGEADEDDSWDNGEEIEIEIDQGDEE